MLVTRSFNKAIPVVAATIFTASGVTSSGFTLWLENQHGYPDAGTNTLVYYFEESTNGTTWTRMVFTGGGEDNEFALLAATSAFPRRAIVQVRLVPTASQTYIRMGAYGDVPAAMAIIRMVPSDIGNTNALSITL